MKNLSNLQVTVTYTVTLGISNVPDDVFEQLNDAFSNGVDIEGGTNGKYAEASEWLNNHIAEKDAHDWSWDIVDMQEEEEEEDEN